MFMLYHRYDIDNKSEIYDKCMAVFLNFEPVLNDTCSMLEFADVYDLTNLFEKYLVLLRPAPRASMDGEEWEALARSRPLLVLKIARRLSLGR